LFLLQAEVVRISAANDVKDIITMQRLLAEGSELPIDIPELEQLRWILHAAYKENNAKNAAAQPLQNVANRKPTNASAVSLGTIKDVTITKAKKNVIKKNVVINTAKEKKGEIKRAKKSNIKKMKIEPIIIENVVVKTHTIIDDDDDDDVMIVEDVEVEVCAADKCLKPSQFEVSYTNLYLHNRTFAKNYL